MYYDLNGLKLWFFLFTAIIFILFPDTSISERPNEIDLISPNSPLSDDLVILLPSKLPNDLMRQDGENDINSNNGDFTQPPVSIELIPSSLPLDEPYIPSSLSTVQENVHTTEDLPADPSFALSISSTIIQPDIQTEIFVTSNESSISQPETILNSQSALPSYATSSSSLPPNTVTTSTTPVLAPSAVSSLSSSPIAHSAVSQQNTTTSRSPTRSSKHDVLITLDEWKGQMLSILESEKNHTEPLRVQNDKNKTSYKEPKFLSQKFFDQFNYASVECGAKILSANPESQGISNILTADKDRYLISPCGTPRWIVVELCEEIGVDVIELANLEYFSSTFKDLSLIHI
eukprot:TRINITY_DN7518_c0_g1_i2.p1 TRINITY_DN7518_c0_g1~~TRINITY_DN7518_c0_g1_i2.p1  ORF type:complete len:346 (+),score=45.74 TRINITY_DN7518_c0_g1_i2:78-1115(+)